jgi:hypothetical protein
MESSDSFDALPGSAISVRKETPPHILLAARKAFVVWSIWF